MPEAKDVKQKLKKWSKTIFGELTNKKNCLLNKLADLALDNRDLTEDEMMIRATVLVELRSWQKNRRPVGGKSSGFYG